MKVSKDKKYRTKSGVDVDIIAISGKEPCVWGSFKKEGRLTETHWTSSGHYYPDKTPSEYDLVEVEDKPKDYDYVNSPKHYNILGDIEVIDAIEKTLTKEEWRGFLKGNIMKYRLRLGLKPNEPVEKDLAKSGVYEEKLKKLKDENS